MPEIGSITGMFCSGWELARAAGDAGYLRQLIVDLGAMIEGTEASYLSTIDHGGDLPQLPAQNINMYLQPRTAGEVTERMGDMLRAHFRCK